LWEDHIQGDADAVSHGHIQRPNGTGLVGALKGLSAGAELITDGFLRRACITRGAAPHEGEEKEAGSRGAGLFHEGISVALGKNKAIIE